MTPDSRSTAKSAIAAAFCALLAMFATATAQSDATLSGLAPSAGTLVPAFASGTLSYTATVPYATTDITVTPTATDLAFLPTITVNGNPVASGSPSDSISLSVGANVISTVVVSQDTSATTTYTITVTRETPNVDLSSLEPSAGTLAPAFASGTISYTASVPFATTGITVTPTAINGFATITVDGNPVTSGSSSGTISLNVGSNTITTVVTGEDAVTTKTYTLTVTRETPNVDLSGLVPSTGTLSPFFASATTSYTATVPYTTTSMTVAPTAINPSATITVDGNTVASGSASGSITLNYPGTTTITTVVTGEDAVTTKTYTLTVTRNAPSADLSSLTTTPATTLTPAFASGTTDYTATVPNATTGITVTPTTVDTSATITVNEAAVTSGSPSGTISLNEGSNTITTVVTAENALTKTYTLTVTRAALLTDGTWKSNADGTWSNSANWTSDAIANGSGFTANFTNDITADRTVSLDGDRTLTNVVFGDSNTATAGSWILNNNAVAANNLILAGTTPTITVNPLGTGKTATISAIVEGTAGLTKSGDGTLILSGANTFTGATTISIGTLELQSTAVTSFRSSTSIGSGATLKVTGNGTANTAGTFNGLALGRNATGSVSITGAGTLVITGTVGFGNASGATATSVAMASGGLIDIQSGSLTNGGFQKATWTSNLADMNIASGAVFDIWDGNAVTIDSLTGAGKIRNGSNTASTKSLTIGANGGDGSFSGVIGGGLVLSGAAPRLAGTGLDRISVTKSGSGTQTLSGANTYTGVTTLTNGTLSVSTIGNGGSALNLTTTASSSTVTTTSTAGLVVGQTVSSIYVPIGATIATIDANGTTFTLNSGTGVSAGSAKASVIGTPSNIGLSSKAAANLVFDGGTLKYTGANATSDRAFTINAGKTATIETATDLSLAGATGAATTGALTKTGAGKLTLTGVNTYTGATTISNGTLKLGADNVIANTSNVTIGAATLDADTRTDTAGTLDVTGTAVINLGSGAALAFADSKAVDWTGGTLNVTGTLGATSLRFGDSADDLTSGQLAKISVNDSGAGTYILDGSGYLIPSGGGPGPLDHFAISAISSPQTVGSPITGITLTAQDASNATVNFTGTVTFGGTGGFTGTSGTFTAGVLSGVSVTPTVAGSGLTFTVTDLGSGKTGTATFNIQTQYQAWAGGALFDADTNNDGLKNGLAFLLGATSPTSAVTQPTVTESGGALVMTFNCLPVAARGSATLKVEHSTSLAAWTATTAVVPDTTNAISDNNVTFVVGAGPAGPPALNNVTATIGSAAAASGKLFGRLNAQQ